MRNNIGIRREPQAEFVEFSIKDMTPVLVNYTCAVDSEVLALNPTLTAERLKNKIESVFADPRGWRKYGYAFKCVGLNESISPNSDRNVLHIVLVSADKAKKKCGSRLGGFSCYAPDKNMIYLNLDNWMGKSASSLPLDRYRTYVINHEVGHRLGFGHPEKQKKQYCDVLDANNNGRKGSVMIQMTRGPDWVAPCVENEWPLDPGEYDETKNPSLRNDYPVSIPNVSESAGGREFFTGDIAGGCYYLSANYSQTVIFILLLALIIIFIYEFGVRNLFEEDSFGNKFRYFQ